MNSTAEKILVIKLSALGDFMLATGAMEAIRRHHPQAHITLLTTRPFADLAERSGWFDAIHIDRRPSRLNLAAWWEMARWLNQSRFDRVYDLQLNDRTSVYYRLLLRKPEWSGVIRGASLFYANPAWRQMHAFDRHRDMLKQAGITVSYPDLGWMDVDVSLIMPPKPYILLVPGSAPTRPDKRWSAKRYGALAIKLTRAGFHVAALGTAAEAEVIDILRRICPAVIDLSGQTSLYDIAALAQSASAAVGNDTGPLHLVALRGCPVVALFGPASRPEESAPVGDSVVVIQSNDLNDISVDDIMKQLKPRQVAAA